MHAVMFHSFMLYNHDTFSLHVVPHPSLTVMTTNTNQMLSVGNNISVSCLIQLTGVVYGGDVDVTVRWLKDSSEITGVPGRVTISGLVGFNDLVESIMSISSLLTSDSGRYECEATVTALQGTSLPVTASQDRELSVDG